MSELKKIEPADREWADKLLARSGFRGSEYCFGNNFIWQDIYGVECCQFENLYIAKNKHGFFFPAGGPVTGDIRDISMLKRAFAEMEKYCREKMDKPLTFSTMDGTGKEILTELYGGSVRFETNRDWYDYIYGAESLRTLRGKKLHSKRNHVNRFRDNEYVFEPITEDNIGECREMNEEWCARNECELNTAMYEEICAVRKGLKHYFELGFVGGLIRVRGRVEAFTFGELLPAGDTFVTHVEKAFTDIQGTYPAVNFEFANMLYGLYGEDLKYINREEDTGEENLRKAKLSYRPEILLEKFSAVVNY